MNEALKEAISVVMTYGIVGAIGFRQARRIRKPVRMQTWVLLVIGVGSFGYILTGFMLISIFGFNIYANWIVQAFMLGILVGAVVHDIRKDRQAHVQ